MAAAIIALSIGGLVLHKLFGETPEVKVPEGQVDSKHSPPAKPIEPVPVVPAVPEPAPEPKPVPPPLPPLPPLPSGSPSL